MADIYSSTTRTTRGEGQAEQTTQVAAQNGNRTVTPGQIDTEERLLANQVTETSETPGRSVSTSTENRPAITRIETKPAITSRSVQAAAVITRVAGPKTSRQIQQDDYGITLTLKIRIRSFLNS